MYTNIDDIEFESGTYGDSIKLLIRVLNDGALFVRIWGTDRDGRYIFENIITALDGKERLVNMLKDKGG